MWPTLGGMKHGSPKNDNSTAFCRLTVTRKLFVQNAPLNHAHRLKGNPGPKWWDFFKKWR